MAPFPPIKTVLYSVFFVHEQQSTASGVEGAIEERAALDEGQAPSEEDEGLAAFPQSSPQETIPQPSPAEMTAVPSTPTFRFA